MASTGSVLSGQWLYNPVEILQTINDSQQEWIVQQASYHDVAKALKQNCRRLGLQFHGQTPGDGNCFFHAVSDQLNLLGLPSQSAVDLRQSVVTFMRCNSTIQGPEGPVDFTKLYPDWSGYCDKMAQDGEWCDHVVLVATAHLLRRNIMVVTSSPQSQSDQTVCWIRSGASFSGNPIMVGHLWEWHYQSLQTSNPHYKDNVIRLRLAVEYICQEALPCISETLKNWHSNQTKILQPCQTPQQCATKGKPKPGKSCPACVAWGNAIESVYYKPAGQQNAQITWGNVDPTRFHHD
ncbi:uncharacterized protein [Amphiura filiformis]|uniref:uncharacterized protein isoform X2 n=1 Tax=Amphiura filiformis TaxID=82378 RepID=UPI003B219F2D